MSAASPAPLVLSRPGATTEAMSFGARIQRTPGRLKIFLYGAWALAALLFAVGEGTLSIARSAVKTIGHDSAPSIIAAQEISSSLADLDANLANYLIGNKRHQATAQQVFEDSRAKVTTRLVDASSNITFGDAEKMPLNTIFDGLGRFLEVGAEARYRHDTGDQVGSAASYTVATDLMHQRILPAATALDRANRTYLDDEYRRYLSLTGGSELLAGIVGAALLFVLVAAQVFLLRRMRRIFNPPLLGASLLAFGFVIYLISTMISARDDLRVAKEDAFDSIHLLWQARSTAADANGDESRFLLDPSRAAIYGEAFRTKVASLISQPELQESVLGTMAASQGKVAYQGLFADEINNVTFSGERQAAVRMLREFGQYHAIDARVRSLEKGGRHDAAVELCIGTGADESNAAFERFDRALLDVIALNHKEFDDKVARAEGSLGTAEYLVPGAAIAMALLALLGLRPRLREYEG